MKYKDRIKGGKGDLKLPSDFPQGYLEKGIAVEMEHTNDPMLAEEIAIDHLTEFPDYYEELEVMEKKLSDRKESNPKKNDEQVVKSDIDKKRYDLMMQVISLRKNGLKIDDIAKETGYGRSMVHHILKKYDDKYGGSRIRTENIFEKKDKILELRKKGLSLRDIAKEVDMTYQNVSLIIKKQNPSTWKEEGYTLHYIDTNAWGEKISEPSVYAFLGKKEVGFFNTIRKEDGLHGSGIMVEVEHRGKGLGKAMLDMVELKTGENLLEASYMYEDGKKLWSYHLKNKNPSPTVSNKSMIMKNEKIFIDNLNNKEIVRLHEEYSDTLKKFDKEEWEDDEFLKLDRLEKEEKEKREQEEVNRKRNNEINLELIKIRKDLDKRGNPVKKENHLKLVDEESFQIIESKKYSKIGFNEVVGLKATLMIAIKPLIKFIADKAYWQDKDLKGSIHEVEYISRDGFSAYSHNKGGIRINITIPKCEEHDWPFLEFGEYEESDYNEDGELNEDCDADGGLDSNLDIMFKLEEAESDHVLFYIGISGGNQDAPYFRSTPIIYETEMRAESLSDLLSKTRREVQSIIRWFEKDYKKGVVKLSKDTEE